jgi:tetratricopeptide (TPR) repeat protein
VRAYSFLEASRIAGVSQARLRAWTRAALVRPSVASESAPGFGFRDLVGIRRIRALRQSGVSLRRIRRSVTAIRSRMPGMGDPVEALRLGPGGGKRLLVQHGGALYEADGQMILDLARDSSGQREVTFLGEASTGSGLDAQLAGQWFERGCRLDADPSTHQQAIEAYRRALAADPAFADAYCNLGAVYQERGQRDAARDCYERALGFDPEHVEANLNLAGLLEEEGREALALRRYKAALRADPLRAEAHLGAALLYEKLGAPRRAREHWRRYLQLAPRGAWAKIARQHLTRDPDASPSQR